MQELQGITPGSYSRCLPLKLHIGALLDAGAFACLPVQAPLRPCAGSRLPSAGCLLPLPTDDLAVGSTTLLPKLLNCPLPPRNLALQNALESTGLPVSRSPDVTPGKLWPPAPPDPEPQPSHQNRPAVRTGAFHSDHKLRPPLPPGLWVESDLSSSGQCLLTCMAKLFRTQLLCSLTGLGRGRQEELPSSATSQETKMSFIWPKVMQQEHVEITLRPGTAQPGSSAFFLSSPLAERA